MTDAISQLASVSAVLGGFALVFLGAIIATAEKSRARFITAVLSLLCSAFFVLCALGWTLFAAWLASPLASEVDIPDNIASVHGLLSPIFLLGILLFFWALGASGWIYSSLLGKCSTAVAVVSTIAAWLVVNPFLLT